MEEETGIATVAVGQGRPAAVYRLAAGDAETQYQTTVPGCETADEAVAVWAGETATATTTVTVDGGVTVETETVAGRGSRYGFPRLPSSHYPLSMCYHSV